MNRALIKSLVPPIILDARRALRPKPVEVAPQLPYSFSEPYPTWEAASADAAGYDAPNILAKVRAAALKAKAGAIAYEQEGVEFTEPSPKWPMLACLLSVLAKSPRDVPHVIDFGGSLGSLYYRHRDLLPPVRWSIVEQASFVRAGKADFEDGELRFYCSVDEALATGPADVMLCGSVLQVVEDPFGLIRSAAAAKIPYLLIDRTPLYDVEEDTIVVIRVDASVYEAVYPYTQLSRAKFPENLRWAGYEIAQHYEHEKRFGFLCRLVD